MLKKILLGTVLVLIISALVFGAVNRTFAKNSSGNGSVGMGNGNGGGRGASGQGSENRNGNREGELANLPPVEPGNLTAEETAALLYMREEEKLAQDVYVSLYAQWGLPIFQNIASSEQIHTDAVLTLLERYGLADPASAQAGLFTNPDLQALYTQLVSRGSASLAEALRVGAAIEEIDILDLEKYLALTSRADIQQVFANLRSGSENHLRAFTSMLQTQTGEVYQPQYLSPESYQAILASHAQTGSDYSNGGSLGGGRGNRGGRP